MEWLNAMKNAIEYLEGNLTEKFDIEKVPKKCILRRLTIISVDL